MIPAKLLSHLIVGVWLFKAGASGTAAQTLIEFGFNEGPGKAPADKTGKLISGFVGRPEYSTDTPSGRRGGYALSFDQIANDPVAHNRIQFADPNGLLSFSNEDFTIQVWVKLGSIPQGRTYYALCGYGDGAGYGLAINSRRQPHLFLMGFETPSADGVIPDDNAWHHLAVVHVQGRELRYYIDGTLASVKPYTTGVRPADHRRLVLGSFLNTLHAYIGLMDRLKIAREALSADALDSLTKPPLPAGGASFNFNEGKGDTSRDDAQTLVGSFIGAPVFSSDTPSRSSVDFSLEFIQDANDPVARNRVEVCDPDGLLAFEDEDFTLQVWLKFKSIPGRPCAPFGYGDAAGYTLMIGENRKPSLYLMGIGGPGCDAAIPDDNLWHHLAVVHAQAKEIRYYIDGRLKSTQPYTGGVKLADNRKLVLGSFLNTVYAYVGLMDRIRILRGALGPDDLDFHLIPKVSENGPN